ERATCTAFAVQADLLATSGRCVVAMERERAQGGMLVARPHGGGRDLPVSQLWQHPSFTSGGAAHADVGLVQISGQAPMAATLATIDQVGAFTASEDVFV